MPFPKSYQKIGLSKRAVDILKKTSEEMHTTFSLAVENLFKVWKNGVEK